MTEKYCIRFNKSRGEPGRGSHEHVWRVFGEGKEYILKHVDIQVPTRGELDRNGADWNIVCEGVLRIDSATSTGVIEPDTRTNNLSFEEIKFNNPGVLKTRLPSGIFDSLKQDVRNSIQKKIPYNHHLVGNIAEEYHFELNDYFKLVLREMVEEYRNKFDFAVGRDYDVGTKAWINLQKKHEFNPIHHHNGALSWVVWVQIPYFLEDEMNVSSSVNSVCPSASLFEFQYLSNVGRISSHPLRIDKFWEGTMVMFPADLKHNVYPFYTSDDYRISIAGNIFIPD